MSQDKYTKSAKDQPCQVRIPGVCNHRPETTVFAHLNGAGMGTKFKGPIGAYACYRCHMSVDGHIKTTYTKDELELFHLQGMARTLQIMIRDGLIDDR